MTIEIETAVVFPGTAIYLRSKDSFAQIVDVIKGREGDSVIVTRTNNGRYDGERMRAFRYKKNLRTVDKSALLNTSRYGFPDMLFIEQPFEDHEIPPEWMSVPNERYRSFGGGKVRHIYLDSRSGHHDRIFLSFGESFILGRQKYVYQEDWRDGVEIVCAAGDTWTPMLHWLPTFRRLIREGAVAHLLSLCAYLDPTTMSTISSRGDDILRAWYGVGASELHEGDVLEVDWSRWKPTAAGAT